MNMTPTEPGPAAFGFTEPPGKSWRRVVRRIRRWLVRRFRRIRRLREIRSGKTILKSTPATINIEFSGRCNMWPPCTYCVGKNAPGYVEPPHISEHQLKQYWEHMLAADRVNDNTYGEPLMYPHMDSVIDRLGEAGVRFGLTTNGLLLNEKKARLLVRHAAHIEICVSLNAASKETYFAHQGKNFETVIGNIRRFIAMHKQSRPRKTVPMILSFIVMKSNRHEVMDFIRLGRELGVKGLLLRPLLDLGEEKFEVANFGHHFVYARERLAFAEYQEIERRVRESGEFKDGGIEMYFAWSGKSSFIAEQAEPGVDIPCLFPWKFLCIRPLYNFYTPCAYIKHGIAKVSEMSVGQVWNGEVMQGLRRELARGDVPRYCCEHSANCPLVQEKMAREALLEEAGMERISAAGTNQAPPFEGIDQEAREAV